MTNSHITSIARFGEMPIFYYFSGEKFSVKDLFVDDEVNIIVFWNVLKDGNRYLIEFINEMADKYYHLPLNFIVVHCHGTNIEKNTNVSSLLFIEEQSLETYMDYFTNSTLLDLFYMEPFETGMLRNKINFPTVMACLKDQVLSEFFGENYKEQVEMFLQGFCGYYTYHHTLPTVAYENIVP